MKKRVTILMLGIFTLMLTGCQNLDYNPYASPKSYDIYDVYIIGKNEVVDIAYIGLSEAGYVYDELVFFIENEDVARIVNGDQVKGRGAGKTRVFATMYEDKGDGLKPIGNVVVGTFVVIDLDSDVFVEIATYSEFQSLLQNNPNGHFYLGADIFFPMSVDFEIIDEFRGVLINPYGYTIQGLKGSASLFQTLENAYIDGLMFEETDFFGETAAGLALYSDHSFISNVHFFDASLQASGGVGGLVYQATNTVFEAVSFEGTIEANGVTGGLVAYAQNGASGETYFQEHLIINSYAYATITNHHDSDFTGGLVGSILAYGVIESSYSGGQLTGEQRFAISQNLSSENVYYIFLYTSLEDVVMSDGLLAYDQLFFVTDADLKTGTMLPGLEAFTYDSGSIPRN